MQTTSWHLIEAAASGNESRQNEFVGRYDRGIRRWLQRRWPSAPLAGQIDDAVQEVFVECFKPGGALAKADPDHESGFRQLLRSVIANVARRYETRLGRLQQKTDNERERAAILPPETTLSRMLDREWAQAIVQEAAREQEERARTLGPSAVLRVELLRLRFHDGLPIRDIAAELELDPSYVHHQYAKARRDFRRALHGVLERRASGSDRAQIEALTDQLIDLLE